MARDQLLALLMRQRTGRRRLGAVVLVAPRRMRPFTRQVCFQCQAKTHRRPRLGRQRAVYVLLSLRRSGSGSLAILAAMRRA
jgi:hypothetical protein